MHACVYELWQRQLDGSMTDLMWDQFAAMPTAMRVEHCRTTFRVNLSSTWEFEFPLRIHRWRVL